MKLTQARINELLESKSFHHGYSCAVANLLRQRDCGAMAEDVYRCNFLTVLELVAIGADEDDIRVLTPIIKEIERKKNN